MQQIKAKLSDVKCGSHASNHSQNGRCELTGISVAAIHTLQSDPLHA